MFTSNRKKCLFRHLGNLIKHFYLAIGHPKFINVLMNVFQRPDTDSIAQTKHTV